MRKPVRREKLLCDNGKSAILCYYLRRDRCFGVEVELLRGDECVRETLRDLSDDESAVRAILERFARNSVTPVALREVWEETIAAQSVPP